MNKIEFSLPGVFSYAPLNIHIIQLMLEEPEKFNDDVRIGSVYGCFPCTWNGGRVQMLAKFKKEDVAVATQFLNENNITIRHTFTNCLLTEKDCNDTLGNLILKETYANQIIKNDINVASPYLEAYVRKNYPDFNIILSTTLCEKNIDVINERTKDTIMVLDYSLNNNFELLKQLKHPENIEILANERCHDNCPARKKHYLELSKETLKLGEGMDCVYSNESINYYKTTTKRKHHITMEDIRTKYLPLGFNKFKLVGRNMTPLYCIEGICEYLVKPEYKDEIRYELLLSYFS